MNIKSIKHISKILFELDPFGTHCKFIEDYDVSDEYDAEAEDILTVINSGSDIIDAFNSVLKEWDDEFDGLTPDQIDYINAHI